MWDRLLTDCHALTMVPAPGNPLGLITNAAIGIGLVSYLAPFAPGFFARPNVGPLIAMALVVVMTGIALRGVRASGSVQIVTTVLKILPLLAVILVAAVARGGRWSVRGRRAVLG